MKRLTLTLGLVVGTAACLGNPPAPAPLNPVRFLLINDLSGTDTLPDGSGGLARVATVRNRVAGQGRVLFVVAGNVLSPRGGMVDALNAAKLDYATFGTREFALDRDTLIARIAASNFKWLSSNCTLAGGAPFPKVLPWDTIRVSDHKVGIFGLTLAGSYPDFVRCGNPDSAAHRAIEALATQEVELIVGLTHQSLQADRNLLLREPRLDLILGGHEPNAQDAVVAGRRVLKADADARSAQFVTLWGGKGDWRQAVGLVPIDSRLPLDSAVARVVALAD